MTEQMSPRQAIAAKCKDCIYDELAGGTWRQQTEGCTIRACALWEHRPMTLANKPQIRKKKIDNRIIL